MDLGRRGESFLNVALSKNLPFWASDPSSVNGEVGSRGDFRAPTRFHMLWF